MEIFFIFLGSSRSSRSTWIHWNKRRPSNLFTHARLCFEFFYVYIFFVFFNVRRALKDKLVIEEQKVTQVVMEPMGMLGLMDHLDHMDLE